MQEYPLRHFDIEQGNRGFNLGSIVAILSGDTNDNVLRLQFEMREHGLSTGDAVFSWLMPGDIYTFPEAFIQKVEINAAIIQVQALVFMDRQHSGQYQQPLHDALVKRT